jgi:hypothetical protein
MPTASRIPGIAGALGLGVSFLLCAALAAALAAFGHARAALGVGIGFALYLLNLLALYATLRSLVGRDASTNMKARAMTASVGRFLLLGLTLGGVIVILGREVFLGAGGGLVLAQISLFFRRSGA